MRSLVRLVTQLNPAQRESRETALSPTTDWSVLTAAAGLQRYAGSLKHRARDRPSPPRMPTCATCGAPSTGVCGPCRFAYYCGAPCQKQGWSAHRPVCASLKAELAARVESVGLLRALEEDLERTRGRAELLSTALGAERAGVEREKAVAARRHALRRAHVSLDVGRFTAAETVGALRDFPEDAGLAVKALKAFSGRNDMQAAIDAGTVAAVVAAVRTHAGVADVAGCGCWALWKIADLPAGQQATIDEGAPAIIVAAMRVHESIAYVEHFGCRGLANIAVLPAGKQAAVDAGAPATIVAAMRAHIRVANVARQGCMALGSIANLPAGQLAVFDAGAVNSIIAALRGHADNADVAEYGCFALSRIALLPAGKAAIIAAGGRSVITALRTRHASAKEDADAALALLL
jgi:hypothetical protein